jgi:hypothetical protein
MSCGCTIYKDKKNLQGGVNWGQSKSIKYSVYPNHFTPTELKLFALSEQAYKRAGITVTRVDYGKPTDVIVHLTTHKEMLKLYPELKNSPGLSLTDRSKSPMHIHLHLENWLNIPKHLGSDFTDLNAYREALISHEFVHVLGYDHVGCACKGCPRDTRQQPSRSSQGCNHDHSEIVISSESPYSSVNF